MLIGATWMVMLPGGVVQGAWGSRLESIKIKLFGDATQVRAVFAGANTALTWVASPNNFIFIDSNLDPHTPCSTPPGSITIQVAPINISGTISYCSNPSVPTVPGVTVTLSGDASGSTSTDGSGNYTLSSIPSGGNYTVTPSKAALTPGSNGINTIDVIAIQRHYLNVGTPLS